MAKQTFLNDSDARSAWQALAKKYGFDKFMEMVSAGMIQAGFANGVYWVEETDQVTK